jgi:hypothetical protein
LEPLDLRTIPVETLPNFFIKVIHPKWNFHLTMEAPGFSFNKYPPPMPPTVDPKAHEDKESLRQLVGVVLDIAGPMRGEGALQDDDRLYSSRGGLPAYLSVTASGPNRSKHHLRDSRGLSLSPEKVWFLKGVDPGAFDELANWLLARHDKRAAAELKRQEEARVAHKESRRRWEALTVVKGVITKPAGMIFENPAAVEQLQDVGKAGSTDRQSFDLMYAHVLKDPRDPPTTTDLDDDFPTEFIFKRPVITNDPFPDQDV